MNIPAAMKSARRWLVWKSIPNADPAKKPRKVPFYLNGITRNGVMDTPEDVAQLGSFDDALRAINTGGFTGLGFALGADGTGNHWQGIDLDGMSHRPALSIIFAHLMGMTYCETSPNRDGIHAIGYGCNFSAMGPTSDGIEAYSGGRFFTVTGSGLNTLPLHDLHGFIESELRPRRATVEPRSNVEPAALAITPEQVADLRSALLSMRSDDRGLWVEIGLALKPLGDAGRALWMEWSAQSDKFDARGAAITWDGFNTRDTDYRAVFAKAQAGGWVNPQSRRIDLAAIFAGGAVPPVPVAAFTTPDPIMMLEWVSAKSTPPCIVQDYLFADVAVFIAPGGMGKTTLKLFEAIHVALGLPLYGLTIHKPGTVLIITSEDSREMLVARLRSITVAMQLPPADVATVMQRVRIADVSGNGFKLTEVRGDVVMPSNGIEQIVEACQTLQPVLIVIDPAVSFGVGESRVNDAEQGLIEAARKLRRALDCCIQYIHHSGKQNARDKAIDQYAGRGGSAFADGARMVHVLQSLTPDEWNNETGTELHPGETGLRLARPKMSYCAPQGDILIRRKGHHFEHVVRVTTGAQMKVENVANQVWQFLTAELSHGRYHSKNTLESQMQGLKRNEIRSALDLLTVSLRIESRDAPNAGKGGKRAYLHPIASPIHPANQSEKSLEKDEIPTSEKTVFASPPPIGNSTAANLPPPLNPSLSYGSPNMHGEPTANLAKQ